MTPDEVRGRYPASDDCSCAECVGYCRRPGWFLPDEIRPLAERLGLTLRELYDRYLVVDWWGASGDIDHHIGVLGPGKPAEHGQVASVGFVTSAGNCAFLQDGKCSIHVVKPFECRIAHHSTDASGAHLEIAKIWDTEEGFAILRELDEYPIEPPEPSFFDLLDLLAGAAT